MVLQSFPRLPALLAMLAVCLSASQLSAQGKGKNPLGELFRSIDRGIRETGEELEREKTGRDQLDIRPIQRPEDNRRLHQAQDLIQQSRWHDAIEVLQFLLEEETDAFTFSPTREFHSLQMEVDRALGALPPDGLRNYLNKYSPVADRLLQQALQEQNEELLLHAAARYFQTPAGRTALQKLAQLWEDQAQFGRAAAAWQRLAATAAPEDVKSLQRSAALALARAGRTDDALQIAATLQDESLNNQIRTIPVPPSAPEQQVSPFQTFPKALAAAHDPDPVLSPRWSQPLIERHSVQTQLHDLAEDLGEQGRVLIPTIQPLIVNGKLIFRSLRGLQVRDLATGRMLWDRRMQDSPEELVTRPRNENDLDVDQQLYYRETLFEHHQLTSLVYRDDVYGGLSSDGLRLFAVESTGEAVMMSPIQLWQHSEEGEERDSPWATNELAAYDLETGRELWRAGGKQIEDPFSRPLAGTYFFGPPTPDGADLYVIGESGGEVSLICLSARTGEERWSQPLAAPGRPIGEDTVRRYWPCRPVLAEGVILCPTTCGWLTAIDQSSHRLLWTARFAPRLDQHRQFRGGYSVQTMQELNRRWHCAIPMVTRGRVIFTPPEMPDEFGMTQPMVYCLDLLTGKTLWEQSKGERSSGTGLYLAGIWNDQALLVGSGAVTARNISGHGETLWTVALPEPPCGRALIVNDKMLIPVDGKSLLRIDLKTAAIDQRAILVDPQLTLGNLHLDQAALVSLTYEHVGVFPVEASQSIPDADPLAIARQGISSAQVLLANNQHDAALTALSAVEQPGELPPAIVREIALLRWQGLSQRLRANDSEQHDATLAQLHQIATELDRLPEYQRLLADNLLAQGDYSSALNVYLDIFVSSPPDLRVEDGDRIVRIDSWTGGRLHELFQSLPDDGERATFGGKTAARLQRFSLDPVKRDRWARALYFHPLGLQLELNLAQSDLETGRKSAALTRLQRVAGGDDPELRAQALLMLADQLAQLGWQRDAANCYLRLQQSPNHKLANETQTHDAAAKGIQSLGEQPSVVSNSRLWQGAWQLERIGLSGSELGLTSVDSVGSGFEALEALRLLHDPDLQRFRIEDRASGRFLASFPLRAMVSLDHQPSVAARLQGGYAFVVHRGVLHALDWAGQQVQWTWSPELRGQALNRLASVHSNQHYTLQPISQFITTRQYHANRHQTGYLVASNERALLLLCRDWIALDPVSGEELWRVTRAPDRGQASAVGMDWFAVSSRNDRELLSAIDGRRGTEDEQSERAARAISVVGDDFIILRRRARQTPDTPGCDLQRVTRQGDVVWRVDLPVSAWLALPDAQTLCWLSTEGDFSVVDFAQGQQHLVAKLPGIRNEGKLPVSVLADDDRYYAIVEDAETQPTYINMGGINASGSVFAFDRTGKRLWNYESPRMQQTGQVNLDTQRVPPKWPLKLLIQDFSENPLLLLVGDASDHTGDLYFHRLRMVGLDKATGVPVIDWEQPSESGGFSFLHVDPEQRLIELRTYNERLRLSPHAKQTAPTPPVEEPKP
ncbi:outer membrane protein assembly factor BamB family protein [Planctomicrobium piriforme]|uniref:Outer membrane protein assembly factor BamB, contains PQQ-like beta-propeller repeat n=1 Tax=Planctomicrobium piriforme TaxID=1576369 RepID=A0A1I3IAG8_9PLAN|nr:PQQ-binding-like beta-propeller repeat protein [Planctomicrobium piriforme]SFI45005.1 Outer membrane protein assembly factor BamB, contains PQQ-like beta-propeller repeat [Planctomicrobium piriforme]